MSELLHIDRVYKSFPGTGSVLNGVNLKVSRGEVACLVGRSGSGKTTLLRCINHLEGIDGGAIWLDGESVGYKLKDGKFHQRHEKEICRMRSHVGMVFQQFNLFSHKTALENVIEGPIQVRGLPKKRASEAGRALLAKVGLGDKLFAYPRELSGGQQQRVAIARALAMEPKLLLFDEPTSALDPALVGEVLEVMRDLAAEGMTMIVVTHELKFAEEVGDNLVFMEDGDIVASGKPRTLLNNPTDPKLRGFLSLHE